MKKLLTLLALLFIPVEASAQCNGVFGANQVCGTVSGGVPGPVNIGSFTNPLVVGTTSIINGTPNGFLYNNGGVLGNTTTVTVTNGLFGIAVGTLADTTNAFLLT